MYWNSTLLKKRKILYLDFWLEIKINIYFFNLVPLDIKLGLKVFMGSSVFLCGTNWGRQIMGVVTNENISLTYVQQHVLTVDI